MNIMIKRQFFRDALVLNKTIQAAEVNPRQRRGKARHKHRAGIMLCGSICGVIVCHGESSSPTSRVLPPNRGTRDCFHPQSCYGHRPATHRARDAVCLEEERLCRWEPKSD